jgi:hypothetical protein
MKYFGFQKGYGIEDKNPQKKRGLSFRAIAPLI